MTWRKRFLFFLATLLVAGTWGGLAAYRFLHTSAPDADAVDVFTRSAMARHHIPGLALAVIRDGGLVAERYYGRADLEADSLVTRDSIFRFQSVSKQFSTAAALRLVERGELGIDSRVGEYLQGLPSKWEKI